MLELAARKSPMDSASTADLPTINSPPALSTQKTGPEPLRRPGQYFQTLGASSSMKHEKNNPLAEHFEGKMIKIGKLLSFHKHILSKLSTNKKIYLIAVIV